MDYFARFGSLSSLPPVFNNMKPFISNGSYHPQGPLTSFDLLPSPCLIPPHISNQHKDLVDFNVEEIVQATDPWEGIFWRERSEKELLLGIVSLLLDAGAPLINQEEEYEEEEEEEKEGDKEDGNKDADDVEKDATSSIEEGSFDQIPSHAEMRKKSKREIVSILTSLTSLFPKGNRNRGKDRSSSLPPPPSLDDFSFSQVPPPSLHPYHVSEACSRSNVGLLGGILDHYLKTTGDENTPMQDFPLPSLPSSSLTPRLLQVPQESLELGGVQEFVERYGVYKSEEEEEKEKEEKISGHLEDLIGDLTDV